MLASLRPLTRILTHNQPLTTNMQTEILIPRDAPFREGVRYTKSYKHDPATKLDLYVVDPSGDTVFRHGVLIRLHFVQRASRLAQRD